MIAVLKPLHDKLEKVRVNLRIPGISINIRNRGQQPFEKLLSLKYLGESFERREKEAEDTCDKVIQRNWTRLGRYTTLSSERSRSRCLN